MAGADERPTRVLPMTVEAVNCLVVYLLREPRVLSQAIGGVLAEHFYKEPEYRILWPCIVSLAQRYGLAGASCEATYLEAREALQAHADEITDERDLVNLMGDSENGGLIEYAYRQPVNSLDWRLGIELLQRFLIERDVLVSARRTLGDREGSAPEASRLRVFVADQLARINRITALGTTTSYTLGDSDLEPFSVETRPTGVAWVDTVLDGGHAAGETYLVYGPEKGGKSMLLTQLSYSSAMVNWQQADGGGPPRFVHYFTYDDPPDTMRNRYYSGGPRISRHRLDHVIGRGGAVMSTRGALLQYEIEMYEREGREITPDLPGELERYRAWKAGPGQFVRLHDMSRRSNPNVGGDGVPEVVAMLNQEIVEGRPPGVVFVDYIGHAVLNQITVHRLDAREVRARTIEFVSEAARTVAGPFQCPVWMAAQYDAQAQSRKAGARMSAADGAEAKTLGAHVNYAFCLGHRDEETNVAVFRVDRARRSPTQGRELALRFNGDMAEWIDVSGDFMIDRTLGRVVSRVESARGSEAVAARRGMRDRLAENRRVAAVDPFRLERENAAARVAEARNGDEDDGADDGADD